MMTRASYAKYAGALALLAALGLGCEAPSPDETTERLVG